MAYEPGDLTATIFAPEIIRFMKRPPERILRLSRANRPVSSNAWGVLKKSNLGKPRLHNLRDRRS